jgi:hypothetical protein
MTINSNNMLKLRAIKIARAVMLMASSSSTGRTIANSYLPFAITPRIEVTEKNNAANPKSFGLYNLVSTGAINTGIA